MKPAKDRPASGIGYFQLIYEQKIIRQRSEAGISARWAAKPKLHWAWVGGFILALAFFGGSSRPDPIQSVLLQPIAALFLIPSIFNVRWRDLERGMALCIFFASLLVWMTIQLVPLPSSFWAQLPSRAVIAEIDQLVGIDGVWRPISLTPHRGLNSVFGLVVPVSALFLALAIKWRSRLLLFAIVPLGLFDAVIGMLQVIGGARSVFYQYAFSAREVLPVGIFANENHSAVFSAIVLLILTRLALEARDEGDPPWVRLSFAPSFVLIFLSVLITGSRAGFVAALAALCASLCMIWPAMRLYLADQKPELGSPVWRNPTGMALVGCAIAILLVALAFIWSERIPALSYLLERSTFEDFRWSLLPVVICMASDHWVVGTGFGSFDAVYRIYEPAALLSQFYVNHAHNDWLQIVIEGGFPAVIIFVGFLLWIIRAVILSGRGTPLRQQRLIFWVASLAIVAAASFVDYPVRTPVFQVTAVWLLLCLSFDRHDSVGVAEIPEQTLSS